VHRDLAGLERRERAGEAHLAILAMTPPMFVLVPQ